MRSADRHEIRSDVQPVSGPKLLICFSHHFCNLLTISIAPEESLQKSSRIPDRQYPAGLAFTDEIRPATIRGREDRQAACASLRQHSRETILYRRKNKQIVSSVLVGQ